MADLSVDGNDLYAAPIFVLGSLISLELIDSTWFGFDLLAEVMSLGSASITVAQLMSASALLYVLYTNDLDFTGLTGVNLWLVYVTIGLVFAPPFYDPLSDVLTTQAGGAVAFLAQTTGYTVISYLK
jgi:hypothetical protein